MAHCRSPGAGTTASSSGHPAAPGQDRERAALSGSSWPTPECQGATTRRGSVGSPPWVLAGKPDDELLEVVGERRPSRAGARVSPAPADQAPVPAQQRLGPHEEARPAASRRHLADRGQQRPVSGLQPGTCGLATQHGRVVAEHQDLEVLGSIAAGQQHQQLDRAAQGQVGELRQHAADSEPVSGGATPPRRPRCELPARRPYPSLRTLESLAIPLPLTRLRWSR
jgi:hypothetical protein